MKSSDYILIQAPMVQDLKLKGVLLLVFARIHSFTKDGKRHFQCSYSELAEWTSTDRRSVVEAIDMLLEAGYINRYTSTLSNRDKRPLNEYDTNYEALLDRVRAGEIFEPLKRKSRRKSIGGADTTKIHHQSGKSVDGGADTTSSVVQTPQNGGADTSAHYMNDKKTSDNYFSLDTPCPLQEQEKQQFYKIFYLKNAAMPAAEVERFVGYNTSTGWQDSKGRLYDTPAKRIGLANLWTFKMGDARLKADGVNSDQVTFRKAKIKCFYKFMEGTVKRAEETGDMAIDAVLDVKSFVELQMANDGSRRLCVLWHCSPNVKDWFEAHARDWGFALLRDSFAPMGDVVKLMYQCAA